MSDVECTCISRNDVPLCRHVILCQCPSRCKDGTVCRILILYSILWSALTYLNEEEIMSENMATCHFMYTYVSLVDCCYWHVGWFCRLQFLCNLFIYYGPVAFGFYLPQCLFELFCNLLSSLKLFVDFSLREITCYV